MSLYCSTLWASLLMELSSIMDTVEPLHTVSIDFTVKRENGLLIGCEINIQCLLAEQVLKNIVRIPPKDVEKP